MIVDEWCYEDSAESCPTAGWLTGHPALVTCERCISCYDLGRIRLCYDVAMAKNRNTSKMPFNVAVVAYATTQYGNLTKASTALGFSKLFFSNVKVGRFTGFKPSTVEKLYQAFPALKNAVAAGYVAAPPAIKRVRQPKAPNPAVHPEVSRAHQRIDQLTMALKNSGIPALASLVG